MFLRAAVSTVLLCGIPHLAAALEAHPCPLPRAPLMADGEPTLLTYTSPPVPFKRLAGKLMFGFPWFSMVLFLALVGPLGASWRPGLVSKTSPRTIGCTSRNVSPGYLQTYWSYEVFWFPIFDERNMIMMFEWSMSRSDGMGCKPKALNQERASIQQKHICACFCVSS